LKQVLIEAGAKNHTIVSPVMTACRYQQKRRQSISILFRKLGEIQATKRLREVIQSRAELAELYDRQKAELFSRSWCDTDCHCSLLYSSWLTDITTQRRDNIAVLQKLCTHVNVDVDRSWNTHVQTTDKNLERDKNKYNRIKQREREREYSIMRSDARCEAIHSWGAVQHDQAKFD